MPLKSQLPRRSRRQQGRSPEHEDSSQSGSVTNMETQNVPPVIQEQNQQMPHLIQTNLNHPFHLPSPFSMYGTTMSHDRTHFMPNVHAMAHNINNPMMPNFPAASSHVMQNQGHAMVQSVSTASQPS